MDIRERILEMVVDAMLASKLNEQDEMDNAKGDLVRRIHADRKFKKAIGPNNRRDTLGSESEGGETYKAAASDPSKKKSGLPLNIPTDSKRGAPVNAKKVRGKSINTSRSTGMEGAKAAASEKAFGNFVAKLSRKEK